MSSEINVNILFYIRMKSSSYPIVNCLAGEERITKATFPDAGEKKNKAKYFIMIFYHCTASKCFWWHPNSSSSSVLWPWVPSYLPNSDPLGRPAAKLPAGGRWCLCPAFLLVNCTCTGLWMSPVEKKKLWFWCYKDWILLCSSHSSMSSLPWSVHHHVCAERELDNVQIALPEL